MIWGYALIKVKGRKIFARKKIEEEKEQPTCYFE